MYAQFLYSRGGDVPKIKKPKFREYAHIGTTVYDFIRNFENVIKEGMPM